jgi:hypothetical protein
MDGPMAEVGSNEDMICFKSLFDRKTEGNCAAYLRGLAHSLLLIQQNDLF